MQTEFPDMLYTVRITSKSEKDSVSQDLLAEINRTLGIKEITNIRTAKMYRLEGLSEKEADRFTNTVLFEPIEQTKTINNPVFNDATNIVEVGYKPGVMNPEVGSLLKSARDLGLDLVAAYTSREYAFYGEVSEKNLEKIINRLLVNKTIEHVVMKPPKTLQITGKPGKTRIVPIRKLDDLDLMRLSEDKLFLNLEEMKVIQKYFKKIDRDPTDCEIEVLAQTWSEHCVHKTFKAELVIDGKKKEPLFSRIKKTAENNKKIVVSSFVDNSGVIDFYDGYAICGKAETHNSPSAIEPYGGAMTGSGGVFRDVLGTGQGAKVVCASDIFCFAPPDLSARELPPGCLPPDYLLRKVITGVKDYGNRVGVPTNNGSIHFHPDFRAKPIVAVGAFGLVPKKYAIKKPPKKGNLILTIGGRTGRDGIHGATFSSGEMKSTTVDTSGSSVQIGNAIEEKRIIDAVLALRDRGLIKAITDCGAGGYSSAIGEMGSTIGATVHLEKVPLKYPGLSPWEIFLSESQERMLLAIDPKDIEEAISICALYNVEARIIGEFDGSKSLNVLFGRETICSIPMDFLHNGLPQRKMFGKTQKKQISKKTPKKTSLKKAWESVMSHGNVASKEPILRLYDHNVQGSNALHPFGGVNFDGPNDGAIVKPILDKPYGLVTTHGLNPVLNKIDPYWGSVWAATEAVANYVAVGGDIKNAALIDNFIWPFPDEASLADLDRSVDACVDFAKVLNMPFISGKDSLSATYRYPNGKVLKIPPTLIVSVFGKIPNVTKTASSDFKKVGSTIVLVGKPDTTLGGSIYYQLFGGQDRIPKVDLKSLPTVLNSITRGIQTGKILSCHDISEGGLATAIAEMAFGGACGAEIQASSNLEQFLFNETAGTFLVEVENDKVVKELFKSIPFVVIGKTIQRSEIVVKKENKLITKIDLAELKEEWQRPIKEIFH